MRAGVRKSKQILKCSIFKLSFKKISINLNKFYLFIDFVCMPAAYNDLYNRKLDKKFSWSQLMEAVDELVKREGNYSQRGENLIGQIHINVLDSIDEYFTSTQSIYDWCNLATLSSKKYLQQFEKDSETTSEEKIHLLKLLEYGMVQARKSMDNSGLSFNKASGYLSKLHRIRKQEVGSSNENSKFLLKCIEIIDRAKESIREEFSKRVELLTEIEEAKLFISMDEQENLHDWLVKAVNKLIKTCDKYRKGNENMLLMSMRNDMD